MSGPWRDSKTSSHPCKGKKLFGIHMQVKIEYLVLYIVHTYAFGISKSFNVINKPNCTPKCHQ